MENNLKEKFKEIVLFQGTVFSKSDRVKYMELFKRYISKYKDNDRVEVIINEVPKVDDLGRFKMLNGADGAIEKVIDSVLSKDGECDFKDLDFCVQAFITISIKIKEIE